MRLLPSGTLSQTLDIENYASAYRWSKRVIDLARQRWTGAQSVINQTVVEVLTIYKCLFTENSVATHKHSSTSINTNKIQYKIQRSNPSHQLTLGINKISYKSSLFTKVKLCIAICYRIGKNHSLWNWKCIVR